MLSRQAEAVMLDLDRSGAPKVPADGLVWICRAGTTRHPGRFRPGTSLLELFGDGRQGYSAPKARQWALYLRNVGSTAAAEAIGFSRVGKITLAKL